VPTYTVCGKPRPPLEVPRLDGLDQSRDDGVVQARVIEVCKLVRGGALIEAIGMRGGWGG
jgi:hypothetical protein